MAAGISKAIRCNDSVKRLDSDVQKWPLMVPVGTCCIR